MSLWGRIFAAGYDTFQASLERNFMGKLRDEMLAGATGRVIEIGSGTGTNLAHYPSSIEELVCTEPEEPMAKRLRKKAEGSGLNVRVVHASAEQLPFEDDSFDTAVATLVLCTVSDPARSLAEVARLLKPGGQPAHAALGHAEHLADLAERQVLHVEEHGELTLALAQARERAAELLLGLRARRGPLGVELGLVGQDRLDALDRAVLLV